MDKLSYLSENSLSSDAVWLIIRHAEKEQPPDDDPFFDVSLTGKGFKEAVQFRDLIKEKFSIEINGIYSSPLRRCMETSKAIVDRIDEIESFETSNLLGDPGPYVVDDEIAGQSFLELENDEVVKMQIEGEDIEGFRDVNEGSKLLLEYVLSRQPTSGLHIFVTHDVIIAALLGSIIGYVVDIQKWIKYLHGLCLYRHEDKLFMDCNEGTFNITGNTEFSF